MYMARPPNATELAPTDRTIGLALRQARLRANLSQAQVAAALGLHRERVTDKEAGKRPVLARELWRWATVLKTTPTRIYKAALVGELALAFVLLTAPNQLQLPHVHAETQ